MGRSEHGPHLVFELLRGRTLQERFGEGPLPLSEAVHIAVELARGLASAHADGVVHRDLKPSNVFLCDRGPVKILDFGMAHAFGHRRVSGGTAAYMAPEQWQDAPEDERTDVFALGVVLYRMLAGELPFPDDEGRWVEAPESAPALEVSGAPALGELAARMLEKGPVKRPRDGKQVLTALQRIQQELKDRVSAGGSGAVRKRPARTGRAASATPSIAVLPFADVSPGRDQEYFADGVAEEILNALAHVEGLRVIGRTSSFSFKGKGAKLAEIGRDLRVDTVLEGSVRREGGRVRITAQLAKVDDEANVWSQTYDRELNGVFAVQDEIAKAVVEALKVKLLGAKGRSTADYRTSCPEAYNQYLAGQQFVGRGTLDGYCRAVTAFETALSLDPRYAPAHAGLANALVFLWRLTGAERLAAIGDVEGRARAAAQQAIALDPSLAAGYLARVRVRLADWDWAGAQDDVSQALALNPGAPWGLRLKASLLNTSGRLAQAIAVTREAIELDPLDAGAWTSLGWYELDSGDPELARKAAQRALEISPEFDWATAVLALSFLIEGRPEQALATSQRCGEERLRMTIAALAQHDLGRDQDAQEALDMLIARYGGQLPYRVAEVHAWRGERDRAFEWLERAVAQRASSLLEIREDPLLRDLRSDPRYAALLERMNLPLG